MRKTWLVLCSVFQIAIYLRALMDAVLKHVGLRSDFIVCHPRVIDDPLLHAYRPPHPPVSSPGTLRSSSVPLFSANTLGILNICKKGSRRIPLIFLSLNFLARSCNEAINSRLFALPHMLELSLSLTHCKILSNTISWNPSLSSYPSDLPFPFHLLLFHLQW